MKKLLSILVLSLLLSGNVYAEKEYLIIHDKINWTGKCFIQYEGKIVVNNELCEMQLQEYGKEKDEFFTLVSKQVECDDGSKGCSYFFQASQDKLFKNIYIHNVYYNVWKNMTRAGQRISPTQIDQYFGGENLGACFLKDNHKFCYEFKD